MLYFNMSENIILIQNYLEEMTKTREFSHDTKWQLFYPTQECYFKKRTQFEMNVGSIINIYIMISKGTNPDLRQDSHAKQCLTVFGFGGETETETESQKPKPKPIQKDFATETETESQPPKPKPIVKIFATETETDSKNIL